MVLPKAASPGRGTTAVSELAVVFNRVSMAFDDHVVLHDLSFEIPSGAMRIMLGPSGSGKSVILKLILGLLRPDAGEIIVNGHHVHSMSEADLLKMRADIGMAFQENALFDSLTVAENVAFRLMEERMPDEQIDARVAEVLGFVGLTDFADRMPSQLSGGQRRRVGIARGMASKPSLMLFDDPITGLDPLIAMTVDDEIIKLRDLEQVTSLLVTHQIRDAYYVATHEAIRRDGKVEIVDADPKRAEQFEFMLLHNGRIHVQASAAELFSSTDPFVKEYLHQTLPPW
ncbi:MAG TPA: ATP-binding cassette domain-containing protein [Vicinamibacterales bacterium]